MAGASWSSRARSLAHSAWPPRRVLAGLAGLVAPVLLAVAWIPFRGHLPDVNVALILVVAVTGVGALGYRGPMILAAIEAAVVFGFFDTRPYDVAAIARAQDIVTTAVLAVVGAFGGELALRIQQHRRTNQLGADSFARVHEAAALLATGEEVSSVIEAVSTEVARLLGLRACWFEAGESPASGWRVGRDGRLQPPGVSSRLPSQGPPRLRSGTQPARARLRPAADRQPWDQVALPVWGNGQVFGYLALQLTPGVQLSRDRLVVAITLADQIGSALAVLGPPRPTPPEDRPPTGPDVRPPVPRLRVVP